MDQGLILEPKWQAILANEMYCGHIVCNPQTPCKTKVSPNINPKRQTAASQKQLAPLFREVVVSAFTGLNCPFQVFTWLTLGGIRKSANPAGRKAEAHVGLMVSASLRGRCGAGCGGISDQVSWDLLRIHHLPAGRALRVGLRGRRAGRSELSRRGAGLSRSLFVDGHHPRVRPVRVVQVFPDHPCPTKIQGGEFRRHFFPNPGDHVALLPGVDVRGFSGPVAQVLALVSRDVQLEGAIRDEDPEGVPREVLHLWAS